MYERFSKALSKAGEKMWRMPLDDEYKEIIRSNIADIVNSGGRYGGAITAAMFLKNSLKTSPGCTSISQALLGQKSKNHGSPRAHRESTAQPGRICRDFAILPPPPQNGRVTRGESGAAVGKIVRD